MAARKRHPRHDELVAVIVEQPAVLEYYARRLLNVEQAPDEVAVEYEVHDLFYRKQDLVKGKTIGWADVAVRCGRQILLIEVKSQLEKWTAGNVIRQLKRYGRVLGERNYDRFEVVLAFFCDRPLSPAEQTLLAHEGVHVLT